MYIYYGDFVIMNVHKIEYEIVYVNYECIALMKICPISTIYQMSDDDI